MQSDISKVKIEKPTINLTVNYELYEVSISESFQTGLKSFLPSTNCSIWFLISVHVLVTTDT